MIALKTALIRRQLKEFWLVQIVCYSHVDNHLRIKSATLVQASATLEMQKLTGRRPMMTRTHCAVENEVCMYMSCACWYCTENAKFEILRISGRRPAMRGTHCVAMLVKKHKINEFMFYGSPFR